MQYLWSSETNHCATFHPNILDRSEISALYSKFYAIHLNHFLKLGRKSCLDHNAIRAKSELSTARSRTGRRSLNRVRKIGHLSGRAGWFYGGAAYREKQLTEPGVHLPAGHHSSIAFNISSAHRTASAIALRVAGTLFLPWTGRASVRQGYSPHGRNHICFFRQKGTRSALGWQQISSP